MRFCNLKFSLAGCQFECLQTKRGFKTYFVFLPPGLQHSVIHPRDPFGLPLDFDLLPQKLKQAGKYFYANKTFSRDNQRPADLNNNYDAHSLNCCYKLCREENTIEACFEVCVRYGIC